MSYVLGTYRTGKTTHLLTTALDAIHAGESVFVMGDELPLWLMPYIPPDRIPDVTVLAPHQSMLATVNPLAHKLPDRPFLARALRDLFRDLAGYGTASTGRFDRVVLNTVLGAMEQPESTLLDALYLLLSKDYRTAATFTDPFVHSFFTQFNGWSERDRTAFTESSLNHFDTFASDPFIRHSLCYPQASVDIEAELSRNSIILVRLPLSALSAATVRVYGVTLLALLHVYQDHTHVFIDDCYHYQGQTLMALLSKKTKGTVHIATHSHTGLEPYMADAIMNLSREKVILRLGGTDAAIFDRYLGLTDTQRAKTHGLGQYRAYIGDKVVDLPANEYEQYPHSVRDIKQHMKARQLPVRTIEATILDKAREVFGCPGD